MRWTLRGKILVLILGTLIAATGVPGLVLMNEERLGARAEALAAGTGLVDGLSPFLAETLLARKSGDPSQRPVFDARIAALLDRRRSRIAWAMVADETGRVIAHTDPGKVGTPAPGGFPPAEDGGDGIRVKASADPEGGLRIEAPLRVGTRTLGTVAVGVTPARGPGRAGLSPGLVLVMAGSVLGLAFAISALLLRRVTQPLAVLASEMNLAALDTAYPVRRLEADDEIGDLFRHFEAMLERLRTTYRTLEEARRQVGQTEKLAALGRLAAGIAHEINNPLDGIRNCVEEVLRSPGDVETSRRYLALVREAASQIEGVVRGLLEIARMPEPRFETMDVREAARSVISLVEGPFARKGVRLAFRAGGAAGEVRGDPNQLRQVFLNLALNALDATPGGGAVEVEVFFRGREVCIAFADTGPGIPADLRQKIFEPFFTTKEGRAGTGMGLSVSLGIVQDHGGDIRVRDRAGGGSVFEVRLPRIAEAPAAGEDVSRRAGDHENPDRG